MNILKHRRTRISLLVAFPIVWAIAVLGMAAKPSPWVKKIAVNGTVKAVLSYEKSQSSPRFRNVRLKVLHQGQRVFNESIVRDRLVDQVLADQGEGAFQVRDLDRDGQPEILVDLFTGGTHCCTYTQIYKFDPKANTYQATSHKWGNSFYQLVDLNQDGMLEFQSRDDRFTGKFTTYAASANPVQIWRFEAGRMVDRTRDYQTQVEASATQHLLAMQRVMDSPQDAKGVVAAYMADRYSLNQASDSWKLMEQLYQGGDRQEFFAEVERFLKQTGYANQSGSAIAVKPMDSSETAIAEQ
ncbi:MAG: hypothetical protein RLZZ511_2179 [Cyanobacteriota bacterium]|jgi:hypothetical protein